MDNAQTERFVNSLTSAQTALYAYITALLGDRQSAQDVLQETNLVLWRKAAEFDERKSFAAWSSGIARYQVLAWLRDRGRQHRRFRGELLEMLRVEAEGRMDSVDERLEALRACLTKLSPEHRDMVRRRYEYGGSIGELARLKKKSEAAISMTLYRLRMALQLCIERAMDGAART
jgi:RNA polymerase sigma-70 factor (ECF subfamily)